MLNLQMFGMNGMFGCGSGLTICTTIFRDYQAPRNNPPVDVVTIGDTMNLPAGIVGFTTDDCSYLIQRSQNTEFEVGYQSPEAIRGRTAFSEHLKMPLNILPINPDHELTYKGVQCFEALPKPLKNEKPELSDIQKEVAKVLGIAVDHSTKIAKIDHKEGIICIPHEDRAAAYVQAGVSILRSVAAKANANLVIPGNHNDTLSFGYLTSTSLLKYI